jgi:hypothetical protein
MLSLTKLLYACAQGLTLVHFSAHRKHFWLDFTSVQQQLMGITRHRQYTKPLTDQNGIEWRSGRVQDPACAAASSVACHPRCVPLLYWRNLKWKAKFYTVVSYSSFKRLALDAGACNGGVIGSKCTNLPGTPKPISRGSC